MEFGCRLSDVDLRDFKLRAGASAIPAEYSCDFNVPVKNQEANFSCVAHAVSSILEYHAKAAHVLSTNFIYGSQRALFNRNLKGMFLRDACKIAVDYGDMLLNDCPGNHEIPYCFDIAEEALQDTEKLERAKVFRALKYFSCSSPDEIKRAIFEYGPVLASIYWYDGFKTADNGLLICNYSGSCSVHAFVIYGYNKDGFLCQNSWGTNWGNKGRFILPYNINIAEARGFIDFENDEEVHNLVIPKSNFILDIGYKCLNYIINMFKKLLIDRL